ncbi:MAG: tetratricopeptide repeat protein [Clostridia bacterium]|nr:tetratricopeptide repeat protein [Clostridia bacterium]
MSGSGAGGIRPIPTERVIEKLDAYMRRRDYDGAGRHLAYWLEEAQLGGDLRGALTVRNELIGHCRKTGQREAALEHIDGALALLEALDMTDTLVAGTTCVNAATALEAFSEHARALALFERARWIYESAAEPPLRLLGGLYNNMGLTCAALGRYEEAGALYDRAMTCMGRVPGGALEQAVTCLNRADLVAADAGMEAGEAQIFRLVEQAVALLDGEGLAHDGYYAFVCEKCAPTLDHYGWFADAERLREEAERIYAGA